MGQGSNLYFHHYPKVRLTSHYMLCHELCYQLHHSDWCYLTSDVEYYKESTTRRQFNYLLSTRLVNVLLLTFRRYCLDIGLDILKLNELTVSCSLMSSLIAIKKAGHVITATYESEYPPSVRFSPKCLPAQPTHAIQVITSCSITHHQPTHSSPIVVHVTEMHCYALLACLHSSHWPPSRTHCLPALILLVGQHLVPVARPASFSSLTDHSYRLLVCSHSFCWPTSHTRCWFAVILLAGHHLVRITRLFSFTALAYSYALLVCPHSPSWPTSRTGCLSALILHTFLLLQLVARLTSIFLTYVRTCGRKAVLGISGLPLVRVARLSSFPALAYSYMLLVCPHSPRWCTAPTRFSFDLMFADLHSDVWQKRRIRYRWPISCTCCSFVLIRRTGLLLCVARLPSFSTLAYCSYACLI